MKKIVLGVLGCSFATLLLTACGNKENEVNPIVTLCNEMESSFTEYQNDKISWDDLYLKIENYNSQCSDPSNAVCVNLKSIVTIKPAREDLQDAYASEIIRSCTKEKDNMNNK